MQASKVIFTSEFGNVKLEPSEDYGLMLSDSNDDIYLVVSISSTSHSHFTNTTPSSKVLMDIDKTPYSPMYMRLTRQGTSSQRPPLHPLSLSLD